MGIIKKTPKSAFMDCHLQGKYPGFFLRETSKLMTISEESEIEKKIFPLPGFGKCHVRVNVLKPGFVPPLHCCEVCEEILLFWISLGISELGVHLHCFKFFLDSEYDPIKGL